MNRLIARFFNEGLDASLSVASKETVIQEQNGTLYITSKQSSMRCYFAALFALPCLYYLYYSFTHPGITTVAIALIVCPILMFTALLLWRVEASKVIYNKQRLITSRLRFFSYMKEVTEPLAMNGTIALTWRWEAGGSETTGFNVYTITGTPGKGLLFSTLNNYVEARAFAERLAIFLGFTLEDRVPPEHRNDR
jgi:hypothetical protein